MVALVGEFPEVKSSHVALALVGVERWWAANMVKSYHAVCVRVGLSVVSQV